MKPQSFEYLAPGTLGEALDLLAEHAEAASVLAGGQSLVPLLNLRLARPDFVLDINRLPGLDRVLVADRDVQVGALVRHRAVERALEPGPLGRLLARVAPRVGHPPIRNRGTVCGSLAHADPAAEWCLLGLTVDAEVRLASAAGTRRLTVDALLDSPFSTTRRPDELITEVTFPRWAPGQVGAGFVERARTAGSFAEAAACVLVHWAGPPPGVGGPAGGEVAAVRIGVAGVGGRPVLLPAAAATLVGRPLTGRQRDLAAATAADEITPRDGADPAGYQRAIVAALITAALDQAVLDRAEPGGAVLDPDRPGLDPDRPGLDRAG